jgi:hypothetical protein
VIFVAQWPKTRVDLQPIQHPSFPDHWHCVRFDLA